jgi:hypothetical protein
MALFEQINITSQVSSAQSPQQLPAESVTDTTQFEGRSQIELLALILLEMKIMNQQLYELPRLIASGQPSIDPPEVFRQEQSIFNI